MSEAEYEHPELPEAGPVGVDDVLAAIQQKNIAQAKAAFGNVMGQKVNDALEAEKVKLAGQIFNGEEEAEEEEPQEPQEPEAELESEEETEEEEVELSLEDEVESAFDEEEEEDAEDN